MSLSDKSNTLNIQNFVKILSGVNSSGFIDKWGPEYVVQLYDPEINMLGFLVIDNTIRGPAIAGLRFSENNTPLDIFRLARTITWKCSLYNLPFGGGMATIKVNPYTIDRIKFIKSFAKKISPFTPKKFISKPDLNIGEKEIISFVDTIGDRLACTGKPEKYGGIPYKLGANGVSIGTSLETAIEHIHFPVSLSNNITNFKIVIEGFGKVGVGVAKYLYRKGAQIIAISDYWGTLYNSRGINIEEAEEYSCAMIEDHSIKNFKGGTSLSRDEIYKIESDVFIPCACEYTLDQDKYSTLKSKIILEGANNAVTPEMERLCINNGIVIIPDILASAGGVIASYSEYKGLDTAETFSFIKSKVIKNTEEILSSFIETGLSPRRIAQDIAQQHILEILEERSQ